MVNSIRDAGTWLPLDYFWLTAADWFVLSADWRLAVFHPLLFHFIITSVFYKPNMMSFGKYYSTFDHGSHDFTEFYCQACTVGFNQKDNSLFLYILKNVLPYHHENVTLDVDWVCVFSQYNCVWSINSAKEWHNEGKYQKKEVS